MEELPLEKPQPDQLWLTNPQGQSIAIEPGISYTDRDCGHEFVKDPDDDGPNFYAEVCLHCPLGRLVRKA